MEQLEMDFELVRDPEAHLGPQRYRFSKDALIVDYNGRQLLFGLWNRLHGLWCVDQAGGHVEESVPRWRPLNDQGVWSLSPDAPNSRAGVVAGPEKGVLRHEANAAFVAYFDAVPKRVRRLVGGLANNQWLALDLIWQVPEFATFLDDEVHEGRIQYIFACCALAGAETMSRSDRRDFAKAMMGTRRREFLTQLSGVKCTKASVRSLYKLGHDAHSADCYRAFLSASENSDAAKVFAHAPRIKPTAIENWLELPEPAQLPNLLKLLIAEPEIAEGMSEICGQFPTDAPAIWQRMTQSLSEVRTAFDLDEWCASWEERLLDEVEFPKPPFEGGNLLRPLSCARDMRREAREMRNCLDDLVGSVLWGRAYFYHWGGPMPATVMLEPDPECGWYVSRVLGAENASVPDREVQCVIRLTDELLCLPSGNEPTSCNQVSSYPSKEEKVLCIPAKIAKSSQIQVS
jgi:hypothetical protein